MEQNFYILFFKNKIIRFLISALIIVGSISAFAYSQYSSNLYADIDGFCYLNTVGSVWNGIFGGVKYWVDPLRSPLLILFIPPALEAARVVMIGYLLLSTLFIFLLTHQLIRRIDLAFFVSVAFGTIPFLLDFMRKIMSDLLFLCGYHRQTL